MKRTRAIVTTVIAIYVLAMAVAWLAATSLARQKTHETLLGSRETFARITDDTIDSVLWYAGCLALDEIGPTARSFTMEQMQGLCTRFHLDELNVVDSNGVVIASNFDRELGQNLANHPDSAEFLDLLMPDKPKTCFGQPYRRSATDPGFFCKYYGLAFPDRSGFLQLGFSFDRLVRSLKHVSTDEYVTWSIGRYGHFEAIDRDGDGITDDADTSPEASDGVMGKVYDAVLGPVYTYTFPYSGLLFRAVVPAREFYEQRNLLLTIGGISVAVMLAFLIYFVVRLSSSSEKLEAMHRAADARTASDLSLARVIQLSSLTRTELFRLPQLDCTFDAATYPAREVGGDFYSTFELADGRIAFLVADVAGKGVPAAMFMHVASNVINACFHAFDNVAEAVAAVNDYLCAHNEAEMFVSAWFGVLDPRSGTIDYVNAGHTRPYVVRPDGTVGRVDEKGGRILGLFPQIPYRASRLRLTAGDRLFLYTDGVTEAMNRTRETFGPDRLVASLRQTPEDLCAAVKEAVEAHVAGAERSDDLTMLSLTWYGNPPRVERTFPATEQAQGEIVDFLRSAVKLRTTKQVTRLLNAADEIVSNVVNYAGVQELSVAVENVSGRCRVTVRDSGPAYDPLTHVDPDTHVPLKDRPIGGLGLLMTKKLVSFVGYRHENGFNVLTLVQSDCDGHYRQIS